ncbi:amino acid adenylation domain-containing protein [Burkholderia pseudomallei]|uniref:non-ribosomal peptide synthetase n=2 Tax=Burkholderia pseudomallei TaxID=28450 RepID=UPI000B2E9E41
MTANDLLALLNSKGIALSVKGDNLAITGDEKVLEDPGLLALLRANKPALIDLIKDGHGTVGGAFRVPPNRIPADAERIAPEQLTLVRLDQGEIDALVARVDGGAANVQDIYPLVPMQEGMLFHHLLSQQGDAYLESYLLAFRTRERLDRFLSALQQVIDRHDILRTAFFWEGLPHSVQVVQRRATLPLNVVELDPRDGDVGQQLEARYDPRSHRIDVGRAPLMQVHAAHDAAGGRWLVRLLSHHLAVDHTTLERVIEEARAIEQGRAEDLPRPVPFRNFVAQARLGVSEADHEAYFRARLGDIDEPTAPFGLLSVQGDGREIAEAARRLKPELSGALRGHARRLGVSAASMMHVAWGLVLSRTTGRQDVVFGTVLFGRMQGGAQSDRALGLFINTLPVRMKVAQTGVEASVKETHAQLAELMRHEHAPLVLAQRCSGVPAQTPLFTSLLNYRYGLRHRADAATPGGDDIELLSARERTNYPLTLSVDDLGQDFSLTVQVSGHVDPQRVCAFMETALEQLAQALGEQPQCDIGGLDVLPRSEREQMVYAWNATERDYPIEQCIHQLFEAQVDRKPEAIALTFDGQRLSYAELNARANRLAHYLQARGVGPDRLVALCAERGIEMVVGLLAILKAGGAYVPLDPAYASDRLRGIVEDSQPALVLADAVGRAALGELDGALPVIDLETDALCWREMPATNPEVASQHVHHLAYVIYTSGSTGRPKGVMVEHAQVVRLFGATQAWFGFDERDVWTLFHSYGFDFSVWEMWGALLHGGRLVIVPTEVTRTPSAFFALLCAEGVTVLNQTPSAFQALMSAQEEREEREEAAGNIERANVVAHRLRYVIFGGEALEPRTLASWYARHGERTQLVNMYGITETTVHVTYCALRAEDAMRLGASPIGVRIPDLQLYVLDDRREPVPMGVTGELYVGGAGVARGYLNRPELTRERFIDDPFVAGGRLYRTGDLARWRTDGSLEYLGRNDFQVKIRGFRIELGEIEAQLAKVTGVREVVVLARDSAAAVHDSATEHATPNALSPSLETSTATAAATATATATATEKRLVAYYTGDADVAALRAQAAQHLPSYMVPSAYVRLDAWPLTPNGKLDRRALPAPADDAYARAEYEAPRGAKEEALAAIWRELLHVERVSRHDNFFELGGHSLLAVQLVSRLRQALSVEVALSTVFDAPVLSALAERLEAENTEVLPPIPLAPRDGRIALSLAQQRLWFLTQLEGVSEAYHMSGAVRLDGPLNREVLQRALNRIVMRHEALRTCFAREEGEPIQVIQPHADLTVSYHDLREAEQSEQRAKDLSQAHASAPFDLSRDLPVRVLLLQLADEAHVVQVVMHHIASDGWSVGVFLQELSALYGSFIAEQDDPLAPLPLQYADYAAWQRRWLASGQLEKQGAFWQTNLSGAPTLLELPTDRPRPPKQSHAGASVEVKLGAALSERVKRLSQRHGVTPYMTLLSSWAAVLSRLSGQEEVVIGSPVAGRNRTEVEALIGFFVNTLALRLDLSSEPTVGELLKRTKAQVLSAQAHQDLPFDQVVERVKPPRSTAHPPLFQVMFVWQNMPAGELTIPGLTIRAVETPLQTAQFELTLSLQEAGDDIVGHLNYASALFDESTVRRYVTYWRRLLEGMTAGAADQTIVGLPLLDEAERKQVVYAWNATERDYPIEQCIHQLFEAQVDRKPEAIALTFEGQRLSYAELNARANRLAHYLQARGVGPDRLVALCAERGIEMVVGLLAILKAGGAYVPLDPAYASDRLRGIVEDSQPALVLADAVGRAALGELDGALPVIDLETDALCWREMPATNPEVASQHVHHLAYVIYTSGSTGRPKGVMVEHAQVVRLFGATQAWFGFDERDVWTLFHSYGFDFSVWEMWGALLHGGRLVIVPTEVTRTPSAFFALLCAEGVTVLNQTPSAFQALMSAQEEREEAAGNIERANVVAHRLRYVIFGGEALEPRTLASWYARHGERTRLVNMYGITETTVHVTYCALRAEDAMRLGASPIGVRIPDLQLYVLDARREPVPMGVTGELYVGGAGVARGYLNRPELTRERFIDDPFVAGGRLYKTGDLARWRTDGSLEYLGRNDFQVKIRGFRIELGEIEAQLAKVTGVREVVVLARDSAAEVCDNATPNVPMPKSSSATEKRLVAYYTGDADVAALRAQAAQHLPSYMVPSAYVRLDAWPLTPNGKLDRRALPAPADDAYARAEYEAPQGAKEEALAAIWRELLHVERVSRHDNFFELGGHSLLAVQLVSRLRQALSVEVALGTVFDAPVLSALASRLDDNTAAVLPPIPLAPRDGRIALSLAQQRLWFLTQLEGVSEAYHMSGAVRLDGPLNREVLQRALNRIVMRHEALRTCFVREEGEPIQVIQPHADLTMSYHDLREAESIRHEAGNREQRAKNLSQAHASAPFDLSRDLPVRVLLLQLADEAHVVQVVMHHIASDGWSVGVFLQELSALYGSFIAEQGDPLAPLPLQYADYAAWQRRWLASGQLEKQGAFWQTNLSGAPTLLELPTDRPRPPKQSHAGASVEVKLGAALSERVKRLSQRHGVTPYMTLLSSWAAVLSRLSGQEEVVIGSPVAGRNRTEIEALIGFFVNTLALRLDLSSEPTVGELLKRTKAQVLSAQAHQDLPFDQVVERVKPPRSTAHPPLFQVMFVWQNAHEGSLQIPGLRLSTWGDPLTMAPFELTLAVREHQDDIACTLTYATSLFDRATVERYLGHWLRQLDAMATDADPVVTGLPLLGEAERAQVLHGWNETGRAYARDACLHQLFEAQVSRTPEAAAVICGDETLSYTDLDARANRLAHYLRGQGVGPDTRVGLALGRGVEMMTGLLAILKAGGAYVPLDPGYASERLRAILDDSRPAIVLADAAGRAALDALAGTPPIADLHADASRWSALPSTPPRVEGLTPRHLAYVIYTSGSTGQPKGVMVEHASVVNLWRALDEAIYRTHPSARRVSLNASIAFDSLVKQWVQLLSGRTLVVVPEPVRFDGRRLLDAIGRDRIDVFDCTPSQLALIEGARGPEDEAYPQVTLVGGEAIGEGMWSELASASSRTYYNVYGPTECTVDATLARITAEHAPHIGGPLANVRAYVLNERLSPAPVGVRGELYIGGAGVARGYLNRPELTRERFIDDPFVAGGRLYRTGDLARWRTDGRLEYLGRNDFQVKIRGFRIELGEIEAQLAKVTGGAKWSCLREIRHRRCTIARRNTQLRMRFRPRPRPQPRQQRQQQRQQQQQQRPRNASSRTTRVTPMSWH